MDSKQLLKLAREIKLFGMADTLESRLIQARENHLGFEERFCKN